MPKIVIGFSKPKGEFKPLSWLIRVFEGTPYSHVYISWHSEKLNRTLIYQASGAQVNFTSPTVFESINETVAEFELEVSDEAKLEVVRFAVDNAGVPYGCRQIVGMAISRIFRLFGAKVKNPFSDGRSTYVCSELVGTILEEKLGKEIKEDLDVIGPKGIYDFLNTI